MCSISSYIHSGEWNKLRALDYPKSFRCDSCSKNNAYYRCASCSCTQYPSSYCNEIKKKGRYGITPLHSACANTLTPPDIIRMMLRMSPGALNRVDDEGNSPLYLACATGSSATVQVLLEIIGQESAEKMREMISAGNKRDFTAMEAAWRVHIDPDFDINKNTTPTDHATAISNLVRINEVTDVNDISGESGLRDLWCKTNMLLFASKHGTIDTTDLLLRGTKWQVVHEIVGNGGAEKCRCPSAVMWLALKIFPDQVYEKNEYEELPLHIAIKNPSLLNIDLSCREEDMMDDTLKSIRRDISFPVIRKLIELHPDSANILDPNGRFPLNVAIESGKEWNEGIECLIRASPLVLGALEQQTKLYPFMLAETTTKKTATAGVRGDSFDFVFRLLRANPEVVREGIRETRQEIYLQHSITMLQMGHQDQVDKLRMEIHALKNRARNEH